MALQKNINLKTISDFEEFIALPENADRRFELVDGEIVENVSPEEHSLIAGNIYTALRNHVKPKKLGRVAFEVRRRMPDDDHNARLPDVEFTSAARLLPVVKKGAVPQMPDLAVEIKSPDDTYISLRERALYYLKNGSQIVWLVFPDRQEIEVHTPESVQTLGVDDALDGGVLLPGFSMAVVEVFEE